MTAKTVKLATDGGDFSYPLLEGSVGPDVIDIRKLYAETDKFTYDPGFTSTASCQSAITYIDGDEGILLHRGYPRGRGGQWSQARQARPAASRRPDGAHDVSRDF